MQGVLLHHMGRSKKIRRYLLSRLWHYHRLWKLNYRVRDGNGCDLPDMVTGYFRSPGPQDRRPSISEGRGITPQGNIVGRGVGIIRRGGWFNSQALDTSGQAFVR